jgi:hypothetical protein
MGIHPSTLNRWRKERYGLPFVQLGPWARYRVEDIEKFIAAGQRPVEATTFHTTFHGAAVHGEAAQHPVLEGATA